MTVFDCAVFQIDFGCMKGEGSFSFYQLKNISLLYSSKKGRFTRLFRKIFFEILFFYVLYKLKMNNLYIIDNKNMVGFLKKKILVDFVFFLILHLHFLFTGTLYAVPVLSYFQIKERFIK